MVLMEDKIPDTSVTSYFQMICVNRHDKATHESCCINLKYQAFVKESFRLLRLYQIAQSENN